jgi:hypothetical protein
LIDIKRKLQSGNFLNGKLQEKFRHGGSVEAMINLFFQAPAGRYIGKKSQNRNLSPSGATY